MSFQRWLTARRWYLPREINGPEQLGDSPAVPPGAAPSADLVLMVARCDGELGGLVVAEFLNADRGDERDEATEDRSV